MTRAKSLPKPIWGVGPPRPAPARWPYHEHRTLAEVDDVPIRR